MPERVSSGPAGVLSALLAREDVQTVQILGHETVFVTDTDGRTVRHDGAIAESDEELAALVGGLACGPGFPRPAGEGESGG
jgi:hypothetical protein